MISSTGRSKHAGFSLLELMVVIFIIGLLSGVAVLTLPDRDGDALLNETRAKLVVALRNARSEAVFSGRSIGLLWTGSSGSFHLLTAEGWSPITVGVLARSIETDSNVRSDISLSGEPLKTVDDTDGKRLMTPQILFLGDGQVTPFVWRLYTNDGESVEFSDSLRVSQ